MPSDHATNPGALKDNGAIFEDTETYIAIHTNQDLLPFRSKYIYLWGSWTNPAVSLDPERNTGHLVGLPDDDQSMVGTGIHYIIKNPEDNVDDNNKPLEWEIYSEEGLSWFSSYVNGLNAFTGGDGGAHLKYNPDKNPYAKAVLMNDLDMTRYFWVPIGSATEFSGNPNPSPTNPNPNIYSDDDNHCFKGTFDGGGRMIKGIDCRFLTGIHKFGLFGELTENAEVKNVFIDNAFYFTDKDAETYYIGGIAGRVTGKATLSASEARSKIDVTIQEGDGKETYVGGLVGKIGKQGETGGDAETDNPVVHSSMAMPEIHGRVDYMGGLVGQISSKGELLNSFSNPTFPAPITPGVTYSMTTGKFIGGLVGDNHGRVENCYSRLQDANQPAKFGWLAGTNTVSATIANDLRGIRYCYIPEGKLPYVAGSGSNGKVPYGQTTYDPTVLERGKYGFKHHDQQIAANANNPHIVSDRTFLSGLLATLNKWVETNAVILKPNTTTINSATSYHPWMRSMATSINDDYPIPNFQNWTVTTTTQGEPETTTTTSPEPLYNVVGSKDKIYMNYGLNLNTMMTEYLDLKAEDYPDATLYLYDVNTDDNGNAHETITVSNMGADRNVMLAINEDVGIKVSGDAYDKGLQARVGVTVRDETWHLFSSALIGTPMGIEYHGPCLLGAGPAKHTDWLDRSKVDPEMTTWSTSEIGYFPTNTPYGSWRSANNYTSFPNNNGDVGYFDLYDYSEEYYHWINYKRQDNDHWHWDPYTKDGDLKGYHEKFDNYNNDQFWVEGKGYLMALSGKSMMMADGVLNKGLIRKPLTCSPGRTMLPDLNYMADEDKNGNYTGMWRGIHLLGNPYQSYLNLNSGSKDADGTPNTFAVLDDSQPNKKRYIYYTRTQSRNDYSASGYIHPHQGFFVNVASDGPAVTFTEEMRTEGNYPGSFRDKDYPLVNLLCFDDEGDRDLTTVEVNRPEFGGGHKMEKLHESKGLVYAHLENESFQTLFAPEGVDVVPVRFVANEDGVFTMNWNTQHGNFTYLHLIDNMTGVDVDCLTASEYIFEGKTTDYKSRFKLVFRCEDDDEPDEPDDPDDGDSDHFAFFFDDELVVNGEGLLQMFDIQGRCLVETQAVGQQSNHRLPQVAAGVYLLRLTGDKKVKVQKMVIKEERARQ